jgi:hypothetical protein
MNNHSLRIPRGGGNERIHQIEDSDYYRSGCQNRQIVFKEGDIRLVRRSSGVGGVLGFLTLLGALDRGRSLPELRLSLTAVRVAATQSCQSEPSGRRRLAVPRKAIINVVVAVAALAFAAPATASVTGALTAAEADGAWTRAHIAGTVTEDGQFGGYGPDYPATMVDWMPVVTVAPSLPQYACRGDEALDSDPNTRVVHSGPRQTAPGTLSFDLPDAAILGGVFGQRVCLSEIATVSAQQAVCIVQAPILGMDPHACPFENRIVQRSVVGRTITVAPPPTTQPPASPPATTPAPAPTPAATTTTAPARLLARSEALSQARAALRRRYRTFRRGRARRITALTTGSPARLRCRATWKYRSRRYSATVTVTKLGTRRYRVSVGRSRRAPAADAGTR